MKIAVFIFGMYRELDSAIKEWSPSLLNSDFYISTWNKSKQRYNGFNNLVSEEMKYKEFDVTPNMITDILPNAVYSILDEKDIFKTNIPNTNKMLWHWKKCLSLLENSGKEYDLILLSRADEVVWHDGNFEIWNEYNEDRIFGDAIRLLYFNPTVYSTEDLFFVGSQKLMTKFIKTLPNMEDPNLIFHPNIDLANHILSLGTTTNIYHHFSYRLISPILP